MKCCFARPTVPLPARSCFVRRLLGALGALVVVAAPAVGSGQEMSGPAALSALQDVMVTAIDKAQRSVVAIARVRKSERSLRAPDDVADPLRLDAAPLGFLGETNPASPDFVPNEFATGVVLDRDGNIVTNYHVLGDPTQNDYYVWVQQRPFKVTHVEVPQEVKAGDPWTDLAVLKIAASDLEPMPLGDASTLRKGMIVIALGNPYGIARDGEVSASWGIVSNLRRATAPDPRTANTGAERSTLDQYGTLIQTDARLDWGTSGGALVNLQGEMVGLTTSLSAMVGYEQPAGFAIPVDDAFRKTVDTLKQGRVPSFGFLGVQPEHLPLADRQAGHFGARVLRVVPGTPAQTAGLKTDDVITHVNNTRVYDKNSLFRELSRLPADESVTLTYERREMLRQRPKVMTTSVVLSKKYIAAPHPPFAQVSDPLWRGLRVEYPSALPPQLSTQGAQAVDPQGCVAVAEVVRDSPAWKAGLRTGQYISHVGTRRVSKPAEFYDAVTNQPGDVNLQMTAGDEPSARRTVPAE
jgi:serine protease Do